MCCRERKIIIFYSFFWQHENQKELEEGMKNSDSGIKVVYVESRPHPDFVEVTERFGYNYGKGKGIKYACLGFR